MTAVARRPAARPPVNKWLVTLSVTFGTLMGTIDASIVNVAVPHLRGAVGATVQEITWVTTGFVVATVVVMPLTGFLGRMFGQKRVYLCSLALFVVGSVLCGMARSLPALVIFRAVQGLGAGALQPTEQAILRQTFPPKEQGMAMAVFGMAVILGPAFGPTLGGYIIDNYSWPWIFFINIPVGILALVMVTRFVHEPEDILAANHARAQAQRRNMDWTGIALLTIGVAMLQYVMEEGGKEDWFDSRVITVCSLVAVFGVAAFVIRELTARAPAVDLTLFKDPIFLSGTLVGAVMFAMLLSITFLLPVYMQELLGFTATQSGMALMPRSLVMLVAMPVVGRLYGRFSARALVAFGVGLFVLSAYRMSHYTLDTNARGIVDVLVIQGVAFSCLFIPLTTAALSHIPRHKMADATGLNSLIRQVGGSLGLAVFATLIPHFRTEAQASIAAHLVVTRPEVAARVGATARGLVAHGWGQADAAGAAVRALEFAAARQAMVLAFERLFLLAGVLFLLVLPILVFLKPQDQAVKAEVHVEV